TDRVVKACVSAVRMRHNKAFSQARIEAQVVADCGKDGVRGVADTTLEIAAAEVAVGFHVSDHSFDGGAAPQLALDGAEDAALLAGEEDAARIGRIVAAVSLVDIGALDLAAGEPFGGFDDGAERVTIEGSEPHGARWRAECAARSLWYST